MNHSISLLFCITLHLAANDFETEIAYRLFNNAQPTQYFIANSKFNDVNTLNTVSLKQRTSWRTSEEYISPRIAVKFTSFEWRLTENHLICNGLISSWYIVILPVIIGMNDSKDLWRKHIHLVVLRLPGSWSNRNLEMMVFKERGKLEYAAKNLSEQKSHAWRRRRDLNPGHICGRRLLSSLRDPCSTIDISNGIFHTDYRLSTSFELPKSWQVLQRVWRISPWEHLVRDTS